MLLCQLKKNRLYSLCIILAPIWVLLAFNTKSYFPPLCKCAYVTFLTSSQTEALRAVVTLVLDAGMLQGTFVSTDLSFFWGPASKLFHMLHSFVLSSCNIC